MTTVLIIDDEETIRFSFASILTDAGYKVIKAAHPDDAKAILSETRIDVAIVDRLIESYNGMDLIEYINKTYKFCTAILISAFPSFTSASKGFQHKLFAYLQKPIKKDKLCKVVEAATQNSMKKQRALDQELELIQAQKMATIGLLSGGMVHDFNNMLMVINGNIDLTGLDLPDDNPFLENLENIREISNQGQQYSNQILSYIKQSDATLEQITIQSLLEKALKLLRILIPNKITINDKIICGNDMVLVHPAQISQVIINLGTNAMHAMANRKGSIDVSIERVLYEEKQDFIKISMKDTGCGMDEETLKNIFESFFSTKPEGMGTGIGLSTARQIITNHGGTITAESQLGKGSTFHVYLPIINKNKNLENINNRR